MNIKKENALTRVNEKQGGKIFNDKLRYPQFYTQLLFEIDNLNITIKIMINNKEGISLISNCNKIEKFKIES